MSSLDIEVNQYTWINLMEYSSSASSIASIEMSTVALIAQLETAMARSRKQDEEVLLLKAQLAALSPLPAR